MSNILIGYGDHVVEDNVVISSDSELAAQPAANVASPHIAEKHKTNAANSAYIQFDFVSAVSHQVLACVGTNLTAAATHRIRLSTTSAAAGDVIDTSTVAASATAAYPAIYHVLASAVSARYLRWDFEDTSLSYLEFGRVFTGSMWRPSNNLLYNWGISYDDRSRKTFSVTGQTFVDKIKAPRILTFTLDFMNEAEMFDNAFEIDRISGLKEDIVVMRDDAGVYRNEQSILGLMTKSTPIVQTAFQIFRKNYTVEERL